MVQGVAVGGLVMLLGTTSTSIVLFCVARMMDHNSIHSNKGSLDAWRGDEKRRAQTLTRSTDDSEGILLH